MSAISTGIFVASLIFTYHTPPKGISISLKLSTSIISLFRQVNKITRKYQTKEADVQSGYELLKWTEKEILSLTELATSAENKRGKFANG